MPSDLLIVYDNAVDRMNSSSTASSTDGTTSVNNLKNDVKGKIHRSGYAGSVSYSLVWDVNQTIGAVALPATNLPSDATVQVNLYSNNNYTGSVWSTPVTSAFTYTDINNWNGYSGSVTANEFGLGRFTSGYLILPDNYTNIRSARITLQGNTLKTDNSRLIMGRAWRPNRYSSNGISITQDDTSTVVKTNSGNVVIDSGYKSHNLSFNIEYMEETDRAELVKILKLVGASKNVFISIFPSTASRLRDDYSIYGRVTKSPLTYEMYGFYNYTVNVEGW